MKFTSAIILLIALACVARCDLPVHCGVKTVPGLWTIKVHEQHFAPDVFMEETSCGHTQPNSSDLRFDFIDDTTVKYEKERTLTLSHPNLVESSSGSKGTWTNIYDEGLFIDIDDTVFFSHYMFKYNEGYTSECWMTMTGWTYHKKDQKTKWRCFYMEKQDSDKISTSLDADAKKLAERKVVSPTSAFLGFETFSGHAALNERNYEDNAHYVEYLNSQNLGWTAAVSPTFEGAKLGHLNKFFNKQGDFMELSENIFNEKHSFLQTATTSDGPEVQATTIDKDEILKFKDTSIHEMHESDLPKFWDWRSINGKNFITSTKNQGGCGSCYTVATMSALESRLNILNDVEDQYRLSIEFSLSCNFYTEACGGGFPFLVSKFGQEFGIMPESCFPNSPGTACSKACDPSTLDETYTLESFGYIGDYWGGNSELAMMKELRARGPIMAAITVPRSMMYYKSGVFAFEDTAFCDKKSTTKYEVFGEFLPLAHSINIVGYGEEEDGTKYWAIQNSWGSSWGDHGFFKVRRGCNDIEVESLVLAANPRVVKNTSK